MSDISIEGLDKAAVLAALYNRSRPQGMGFLHYDSNPMTAEAAQTILNGREGTLYFDYLMGRVMKVDLSDNTFDPWLYDRDNGAGAAEEAINELRATGDVNTGVIQRGHQEQTREAANLAKNAMQKPSGLQGVEGGVATFHLSLSDMTDKIGPIVDDILD